MWSGGLADLVDEVAEGGDPLLEIRVVHAIRIAE